MINGGTSKKIALLPTLVTLGNTFCGFLAILFIADSIDSPELIPKSLLWATWLIFIAMLFDAIDGKIARVTNVATDFGAQLDSITDAITFGVAPVFLVKVLVERFWEGQKLPIHPRILILVCSLYVLCAVLRLARYNVESDRDESGREYFNGLPTPGAAGALASLCLLYFELTGDTLLVKLLPFLKGQGIVIIQALPYMLPILGILMVSRLPYFHMVNVLFKKKRNFATLVQVVFVLVFIVFFPELALVMGFVGYLFTGPVFYVIDVVSHKERVEEESLF